MLEYDFMRTAFVASGVAAILAGTVGYFLVLRGQTFAGHALSHVGFTGATGAILFGLSPLAGLVGFTFVSGIGMGLFGEKLAERDVAIGMMLSLALGLGLLFLHFYTTGATQAAALLFGNVLGVDNSALTTLALLSIGSLVALAYIARPLIFASLQPDLAEARGVPLRFVSVAFLAIVGIAVAECAQIVGVLLVFTLMVGPAAAAQNFSRRLIGGVVAGGRSRARGGVGRFDAGLLHRLADLVLDHGALRSGLSREPRRPIPGALIGGGAAICELNRVRPHSAVLCEENCAQDVRSSRRASTSPKVRRDRLACVPPWLAVCQPWHLHPAWWQPSPLAWWFAHSSLQ